MSLTFAVASSFFPAGLDSATALVAKVVPRITTSSFVPSFDYGQRHRQSARARIGGEAVAAPRFKASPT